MVNVLIVANITVVTIVAENVEQQTQFLNRQSDATVHYLGDSREEIEVESIQTGKLELME